jgi:cell division protein FtsB
MDNQVIILESRIQELQAENTKLRAENIKLREEIEKLKSATPSDPQHCKRDSLYPDINLVLR